MNETSSTLTPSGRGTTGNRSTYIPGTLLNVLTSTKEVTVGVTSPTRGITPNESSASWYDTGIRNTTILTPPISRPRSQLYGVIPGICVGFAMVVFLGISFFHYHRRFRRKRKLALEYVGFALDAKRPRIASPGCFMNLQQLNEIGMFSVENTKGNGNAIRGTDKMKIEDIPISVILNTSNGAQPHFTVQNPVFKMDEQDIDENALVTFDTGSSPREQDLSTAPPNLTNSAREVELRLSELCNNCADKVLSSSQRQEMFSRGPPNPYMQVQKRLPEPIDSDLGEYHWNTHDDCETMDAFHGRPQLRERRRTSMPTPVNRFGLKENNPEEGPQRMLLCPYCYNPEWQSTRL